MLSTQQIRHLVRAGDFERLIERVLANGRSKDLPLRLALTQAHAAQPAAIGLALQRACELSWGLTPDVAHLAARLIALQGPDGGFRAHTLAVTGVEPDQSPLKGSRRSCDDRGSERRDHRPAAAAGRPGHDEACSLAATAAALRGLVEYARLRAAIGAPAEPGVTNAVDRGLFALARSQQESGLFDADPIENAIILWQLGPIEAFQHAVRYHDFRDAVDEAPIGTLDASVKRLAFAVAA